MSCFFKEKTLMVKICTGHDRYHSISETGSQMSPDGLGWIIVDSLDTMMIMNLTSRVVDAGNWIEKSLHYDQDQDVNTFETTIRMLGGLLSAHYLTTRYIFILSDPEKGWMNVLVM
jgi:mannosyl-oligosaccharide alpha-1,2-mannosidase